MQNTESAINLTVRNGDENAYTTRAVTVVANVKLSGVTKNYGGGYIEFILPPEELIAISGRSAQNTKRERIDNITNGDYSFALNGTFAAKLKDGTVVPFKARLITDANEVLLTDDLDVVIKPTAPTYTATLTNRFGQEDLSVVTDGTVDEATIIANLYKQLGNSDNSGKPGHSATLRLSQTPFDQKLIEMDTDKVTITISLPSQVELSDINTSTSKNTTKIQEISNDGTTRTYQLTVSRNWVDNQIAIHAYDDDIRASLSTAIPLLQVTR